MRRLQLTSDWLRSNPRGYAAWFRFRQGAVLEQRRKSLAAPVQAKVEDIPNYKVKTPLQSALLILKRHRDVWAAERPELKPISIILTTLAAHAYRQETLIAATLARVLADMDKYITVVGAVTWIANPSDPPENFADKWAQNPDLESAFFEWLAAARADFAALAQCEDAGQLLGLLAPKLGERAARAAARKRIAPEGVVARFARGLRELLSAPHRQAARWPAAMYSSARIVRAVYAQDGYRSREFASDGPALPKRVSLRFEAKTDVPRPFKVYWQVVNTGREAGQASQLRGAFEEHEPERGGLIKEESTLYSGTHSIQCFIVKDGRLVAQSQLFIVNIR